MHTARPRASRASKPKVRTGCLRCRYVAIESAFPFYCRKATRRVPCELLPNTLCRERHLKCDEGKPGCLRCNKSRLVCCYRSGKVNKIESRTARQLVAKADPFLGGFKTSYPSTLIPGETGVENRYFRHFQDSTALPLAGPFNENLWARLMLQGCQHEPFVRHAVVAIGALDKSRMILAASESSTRKSLPTRDMHREFALLQYNKSLQAMKSSICDTKTNPRRVLVACLLVVCLENIFSNKYLALSHALAGHRILQDWLMQHPHTLENMSGISSPAPSIIEDELVLVFGKLDLQISCKYDPRPSKEHIISKQHTTTTIDSMPPTFSNPKEAKVFFDVVMRRAHHFISCALITSNSAALSRPFESIPPTDTSVTIGTNMHSTTNIITDQITAEQIEYAAEVSRWSQAFQPVFRRLQHTTDHRSRDALLLLRIHYLATKIIVAAVVFEEETSYDQFAPEFREIVHLIKLSQKYNNTWARAMSFELGLASPLFLVTTKCRDRLLRREAISIMRSLPDEGSWDPEVVAILATWLMEVEEEGVLSEVIPETSRAIISRVSDIPKGREALFQCIQRKGGPNGEPIWKEKLVRW